MVEKLILLTPKMKEELRRKQFRKQKGRCAILRRPIAMDDAVMDHKHKLKAQDCGGPQGLGCCRGIIHRNVNSFEGKLERLWKRYGLTGLIDLPTLLRRCADYIESPPMEPIYVHPNEKPKRPKLKKSDYNRICKYYFKIYPNRRKLPEYPKDGIMTERWKSLVIKANNMYINIEGKTPPGYSEHIKRIRSHD